MITRLDPSPPEARQWLADELAKPDYQDTQSLFERFVDWLSRLFNRPPPSGTAPDPAAVPTWVIVALVILLIAALLLVLTRVRAERRTAPEASGAVLGDLDLSAPQFRARGEAALREGRWSDAVLEFTRALAREAADRTLLQEAPSLTAHEVGIALAPIFPLDAADIWAGMDVFDRVCYGRHPASQGEALAAQHLDQTLLGRRPVLSEVPS